MKRFSHFDGAWLMPADGLELNMGKEWKGCHEQ